MARHDDTDASFRKALNAVQDAYGEAVSAVGQIPDRQRAFEAATTLRDELDRLVGEAATVRARMAHRIWEAEELSLAQLADRIGVSKARADQLVRLAGDNARKRRSG